MHFKRRHKSAYELEYLRATPESGHLDPGYVKVEKKYRRRVKYL